MREKGHACHCFIAQIQFSHELLVRKILILVCRHCKCMGFCRSLKLMLQLFALTDNVVCKKGSGSCPYSS